MNYARVALISFALSMASCANTPTEEGPSDADLERDCHSFCNQAVPCSEEFARSWQFESVSECVDTCLTYTNFGIETYPSHDCEMITGAMWSCAGELPTCEEFAQFEDAAYAMTDGLIGEPCGEEISMFLMLCN